jgi:hypothetical protein
MKIWTVCEEMVGGGADHVVDYMWFLSFTSLQKAKYAICAAQYENWLEAGDCDYTPEFVEFSKVQGGMVYGYDEYNDINYGITETELM